MKNIIQRSLNKGRTEAVPVIVRRCIDFLRSENRLRTEGLFRLSGDVKQITVLKRMLDVDEDCPHFQQFDTHVVAGILKAFLRELAEPVLTWILMPEWLACVEINDQSLRISELQRIAFSLPHFNRETIRALTAFLKDVSDQCEYNKMTISNLAVVFGPCLLPQSTDSSIEDANAVFLHTEKQVTLTRDLITFHLLVFSPLPLDNHDNGPSSARSAPIPMQRKLPHEKYSSPASSPKQSGARFGGPVPSPRRAGAGEPLSRTPPTSPKKPSAPPSTPPKPIEGSRPQFRGTNGVSAAPPPLAKPSPPGSKLAAASPKLQQPSPQPHATGILKAPAPRKRPVSILMQFSPASSSPAAYSAATNLPAPRAGFTNSFPRLIRFASRENQLLAEHLPPSTDAICGEDSFLFDNSVEIILWHGSTSSSSNRAHAVSVLEKLCAVRRGQRIKTTTAEQGSSDGIFFDRLGGRPSYIPDSVSISADSASPSLFLLTSMSGSAEMVQLAIGAGRLRQNSLFSSEVYLVDFGFEVLVWVGSTSSTVELELLPIFVKEYLESLFKSEHTHVTICTQALAAENALFNYYVA